MDPAPWFFSSAEIGGEGVSHSTPDAWLPRFHKRSEHIRIRAHVGDGVPSQDLVGVVSNPPKWIRRSEQALRARTEPA